MGPELFLRALLLAAAAWPLVSTASRGIDRLVFAGVGLAVLASLLWRMTFVPGAALSVVAICTSRRLGRIEKIIVVIAAAGLAALAIFWPAPAVEVASTSSPPEETTRALERGNLYEARFWASRWSATEGDDPRNGTLIWARVENLAGHGAVARSLATDVAEHAHAESMRERAREELASFGPPAK